MEECHERRRIGDAWTTSTPTLHQRRRIDARVFAWLEAREHAARGRVVRTVRVAQFHSARSCHGSAVSIVAAIPLVWFAYALM